MANWLVAAGHAVDVLILKAPISQKVKDQFSENVVLKELPKFTRQSPLYPANLRKLNDYADSYRIVLPFCSESLLVAHFLDYSVQPTIIPYVLYISQYCEPTPIRRIRKGTIGRRLFRQLSAEYIIFMSDQIRLLHENSLRSDYRSSFVMPLPIDCERFGAIPRDPTPFVILSVGRIDRFMKLYNFSCIPIIKRLHEEGFQLTWTIYGGAAGTKGEWACKELVMKIRQEGAEGYIQYKGELDYKLYPQALSKAYGFIGMGTSVLEAAAAGVPSIVAIAEEPSPITQGFVHEMPVGCCGEFLPDRATYEIYSKLKYVITSTPSRYQSISAKEAAYVRTNFDLDTIMNRFVSHASALPSNHQNCDTRDCWKLTAEYQIERIASLFTRIVNLGNRQQGTG